VPLDMGCIGFSVEHERGGSGIRTGDELGVPTPDYPAPVANAVAILNKALGYDGQEATDA
jgi:hypothetical protein